MRSFISLSVLVAILPTFGASIAASNPLTEHDVKNTYVVKIKDEVSPDNFMSALKLGLHPGSIIKNAYTVINAVAATIDPADMSFVRGLPGIEYMEQDQIMSVSFDQEHTTRRSTPLVKRESCPEPSFVQDGGKGVTIYSLGTLIWKGVKTEHECFGGRAKWGAVFGGYNMTDDNGHGTHTAGTVIGNYYGIARGANVVVVKVFGKSGTGAMTDVISGVNYACNEFKKNNFTSSIIILPMSGVGTIRALDNAITNCAKMGMHFVVTAGNMDRDAGSFSPARVPIANTVGAINSTCYKVPSSNFGPVLDVHALGVNVTSAGIGPGNNATKMASGTSLATSYVAGILAITLEKYGNMSPEDLTAALKSNAYKGALGFPNTTTDVAQLW
ncbi:unnamed protein product [Rhizoctonia solani]|uniref:Peptidase S8/S53 domain-containing protein n=1 Tax=Rhizoctonia solani TaxID=456999 RepID=A0A8H3BXS1_9AGAM|nr:unnamed protein product [Rhizoctonia solani]CAE6471363.1 unnamed protein product [Rhizoctonia solani]